MPRNLSGTVHPFAYNDIAAIGMMRVLEDAGVRIPEDVSVVGFDDIVGASFTNPGLTTVRQPLKTMGQIAAQTVIEQIAGSGEHRPEILIDPEFVVRGSTGEPSGNGKHFRKVRRQ